MDNFTKAEAESVAKFKEARDRWWEGLSMHQKRAITKQAAYRQYRRDQREALRAAPAALPYACPKCLRRYPSAAERNACKRGHRAA